MTVLQQQLEQLRHGLQCSATLDYDSPHLRICTLAIPWCGRHLRWQLLLPPGGGAPDIVFDDDSFRPLCDPPRNHQNASGSTLSESPQTAREILLRWSSHAAAGGGGGSGGGGGGGAEGFGSAGGSVGGCGVRPGGLSSLVAALLEAYRGHQAARLEAVAARLPRLHFELSTLGLGAGVQLELQAQQACFAVPLSSLDLRRLLDTIRLYGGRLPQSAEPPAAERPFAEGPGAAPSSQQHQHQHGHVQQPQGGGGGSLTGVGGQGPAGVDPVAAAAPAAHGDADDVLEPLEGPSGGGGGGSGRASVAPAGVAAHTAAAEVPAPAAAEAGAVGSAVAAPAAAPPPLALVLEAAFRLPAGSGADLPDPELTLQVPPALAALQSPGASAPSSSSSTAAAAASSAAGAGPAVPLVPPLLLPPWSAHMCLAAYVPLAVERLGAQIEAHCALLEGRQQLLAAVADLLGPPLELNLRAGAALFSLAWEGAPLMLTIELGPRFPTDKPSLTLHGARPLGLPDPVRTYTGYPWSPRWAPREMAARIYNWLRDELPNFTRGKGQ